MLTCDDFCGRLYDEDCRRALTGEAPVPGDMSAHRDACSECYREWTEAVADLTNLPAALLEPAPPSLIRKVRIATADRTTMEPALDWSDGLLWAAIGAAAAVVFTGPISAWLPIVGPFTVSVTGASLAFTANAMRGALREALR